MIAAMARILRDRLREALLGPPLVIAAMLHGAIMRLTADEGIAPARIRILASYDRRLWRVMVDRAEVFTVYGYTGMHGIITGYWTYPPEAAHAASTWMEGAEDGEAT